MTPQGSSLISTEYFDNLKQSIDNVQTCAELQKISTEAMASLSAIQSALASEMAALEPILALLTAPGVNLGQVVTWITNFIHTVLDPMYKPYLTYELQLVEFTTQIAELVSAINDAKARIPHCSFTTPTI